jgi:hypothetical protein
MRYPAICLVRSGSAVPSSPPPPAVPVPNLFLWETPSCDRLPRRSFGARAAAAAHTTQGCRPGQRACARDMAYPLLVKDVSGSLHDIAHMDVLQQLVVLSCTLYKTEPPSTHTNLVLQQNGRADCRTRQTPKYVLHPCKSLQERARGVHSKHPCPQFGQS